MEVVCLSSSHLDRRVGKQPPQVATSAFFFVCVCVFVYWIGSGSLLDFGWSSRVPLHVHLLL